MIASVPRAAPAGSRTRGQLVVASQLLAIDSVLRRLAAARSRLLPASAFAAHEIVARKVWFHFGYARASDFARERWGRTGRWLQDRAALGDRFRCFPALARAVTGADGEPPLGSVSALLVGRVATAENLEHWICRARQLTVRALRAEVSRTHETPDEPDAVPIALRMPGPIRVAFEESLELHRAVVGAQASVEEFLEALIADGSPGFAGEPARDDAGVPSNTLPSPFRCTRFEVGDRKPLFASPAFRQALDCLARAERWTGDTRAPIDLEHPAHLERVIRELLRLEDEIETRIGALLAELDEHRAWRSFHCEGVSAYAEAYLGLSSTTAWRRASIVRRLRGLTEVRRAYLEGAIGIEAAEVIRRALGGPADIAIQQEWLARARTATLKRLLDEEQIALRQRFLEGRPAIPSSDAIWHRSRQRIPGRGLAAVIGAGCRVLDAITTRVSHPDVFLCLGLSRETARDFHAAIEIQRRAVAEQAEHLDAIPVQMASRARPSLRIASALRRKYAGVPAWVGLLALLEEFAFTWDVSPHRAGDAIYVRAGYRCEAPGCTSRRNLEVHHVVYRSRGGASAPENLVCLCRMHHQQGEHGGRARCRGRAPLGVVWRLGVPNLATWFRNEMRLVPAG